MSISFKKRINKKSEHLHKKKQIREGQMPDHYLNMRKTALSSLDDKIKR